MGRSDGRADVVGDGRKGEAKMDAGSASEVGREWGREPGERGMWERHDKEGVVGCGRGDSMGEDSSWSVEEPRTDEDDKRARGWTMLVGPACRLSQRNAVRW